jgi:hypothetical protein
MISRFSMLAPFSNLHRPLPCAPRPLGSGSGTRRDETQPQSVTRAADAYAGGDSCASNQLSFRGSPMTRIA